MTYEKVPSPESDGKKAAEYAYLLERRGDAFLSREERIWIDKTKEYST